VGNGASGAALLFGKKPLDQNTKSWQKNSGKHLPDVATTLRAEGWDSACPGEPVMDVFSPALSLLTSVLTWIG